jgi:hypothetical protein
MKHFIETDLLVVEFETLSLELGLAEDEIHKNKLLHQQKQLIDKLEKLIHALSLRLSSH